MKYEQLADALVLLPETVFPLQVVFQSEFSSRRVLSESMKYTALVIAADPSDATIAGTRSARLLEGGIGSVRGPLVGASVVWSRGYAQRTAGRMGFDLECQPREQR